MRALRWIGIFIEDDDGAVTVDWVVLTSAIVGLTIAVMLSVGNSTSGLADKISGKIQATNVWDFSGGGGSGDGTPDEGALVSTN